jgi:4-amino-4-deoxy-L-arabinose transferase-like glycosyltransferase
MKHVAIYKTRIFAAVLLLSYFATRLYNLTAVPIFTDEAIYIRWVQIFRGDIGQLFVSLNDGKQPLFIWLGYPFNWAFSNPLLAQRLVSAFAGFSTMLALYLLSKELFSNKRTAFFAAGLYIVLPFALVYDKLALYDSLLATFAVWSLYFEIKLVKQNNISNAIFAGAVIGCGLLTKSSAYFFLLLLPTTLVLFNFNHKTRNTRLLKWLCLAILTSSIALTLYSVLRFSTNYHFIADKNNVFVYPLDIWIKHPLKYVFHNIEVIAPDFIVYFTPSLLVLATAAFLVTRKFYQEKLLLLCWFTLPFIILALFGNSQYLYPRYTFFMAMPLIILSSFTLNSVLEIKKYKTFILIALSLLFIPIVRTDFIILSNFSKAPIPNSDRKQLITGYASGIGVNETVKYINQEAKENKIYVGTEGLFGLMPEALIDNVKTKNAKIKGFWPIESTPPQELSDASKKMQVYFVFYAPCSLCDRAGLAPKSWPVKKVFSRTRLDGTEYTLYKFTPTNR